MARVADCEATDLGSILGQVLFQELFVNCFCWIRLIRRELWKVKWIKLTSWRSHAGSIHYNMSRLRLSENNALEFPLNGTGIQQIQGICLINHWNMNWVHFKVPVSDMCLAGTVVLVSYTRGGRVAGSSSFTVMTNILVTEISEFSENIKGKIRLSLIFLTPSKSVRSDRTKGGLPLSAFVGVNYLMKSTRSSKIQSS